jgi:DMSO/TMAO reductase YedYZ molybdopterin-dependent catalytic subunit
MDPRLIVVTVEPANAETPLDLQRGDAVTPNELFFMRNRFQFPRVDVDTWRLEVSGLVERPLSLSLAELRAMPSHTLPVTLECAGNGRVAMEPPAEGEPWGYGAVSTASWMGVPLCEVLRQAGVRDAAIEILFEGIDDGDVAPERRVHFQRSLPLDKALHRDTLLAHTMNGEPLPVEHGAPLRLVVPGWYGMASVKWLASIRAIDTPFHGFFQGDRYVLSGGADDPNPRPVTVMGMRSLILEPAAGATLRPGRCTIRGLAWAGDEEIAEVQVSTDGGETWRSARWTGAPSPYAWRAWEFEWRAGPPGPAVLQSRAVAADGRTQPTAIEWNYLGYCNNAIQSVEVTVE